MKHLKKFTDIESLTLYKNSEEYIRPNVSLLSDSKEISYETRYDSTLLNLTPAFESERIVEIPLNHLVLNDIYMSIGFNHIGRQYSSINRHYISFCVPSMPLWGLKPGFYPLIFYKKNNNGLFINNEEIKITEVNSTPKYYEYNNIRINYTGDSEVKYVESLKLKLLNDVVDKNIIVDINLKYLKLSYQTPDNILYDFTPVYDKQVNKVCLYDKINNIYTPIY